MVPRFVGFGRASVLGLALATLAAGGCSENDPRPPLPTPTLAIAPNSVVLGVGGGIQFVVSPNGRASEVVWSTGDPTVAEVSAIGFVTARQVGTAQITARAGSETATARVVVSGARCLLRCPFDN